MQQKKKRQVVLHDSAAEFSDKASPAGQCVQAALSKPSGPSHQFAMKRKVQQKTNTRTQATLGTLLTGEKRNVCSIVTVWNATELSTSQSPQWRIDTSQPSNQPLHHVTMH